MRRKLKKGIKAANEYFMDVEETEPGEIDWPSVVAFYGMGGGMIIVSVVMAALTLF